MKTSATHHNKGFTLVELMVAMVISLLLLGGVAQVFIANQQSYRLLEASSNVQESGRFSMQFLVKDIRMAGFMGCARLGAVTLNNNVNPASAQISADTQNTLAAFDGTNGLIGYTYDGSFPADLTTLGLDSGDVIQGSDILFIQRAQGCPGADVYDHGNSGASANYKIADNSFCQIRQGDIVLVSDCTNADIHGVTNSPDPDADATITHAANWNLTPQLANTYGPGSSVYKMTAMLYYIGFGTSGEPALFRRQLVLDTGTDEMVFANQELVEGIYDMDITYGVDTTNDAIPNRLVSADDVSNWQDVVSVNTVLRVRSRDASVTEQTNTYTYNGSAVTDRRLQRDFAFTTTVRNRTQ